MAIVSFEVVVDDIQAALAFYDVIQVWRSPDQSGSPVPYVEITAASPEPAIIDSSIGPWTLDGQSLGVSLSGADLVSVVFSGTDLLDLQSVIDQINEVIPGFASESGEDTGRLRLTSPITGTGASILLIGNAATTMSLLTTKVNGKGARLGLVSTNTTYLVRDFDGSLSYWYKTRFYSTKTKATSAFSSPRQGASTTAVSESFTSVAKVNLADGSGAPVAGRRIIFVPVSVRVVDVGGGTLYGAMPGVDRLIITTDDTGHAEMSLIRGASYRVFFEGTTYQREFTVPDSSEFNLLTILSSIPDVFSIVQTPPMPIRS
jgi:hypothetical protein